MESRSSRTMARGRAVDECGLSDTVSSNADVWARAEGEVEESYRNSRSQLFRNPIVFREPHKKIVLVVS